MSIILIDTFHHLSSSYSYTEPLEHYSVQIPQLVSILFVIKTSDFTQWLTRILEALRLQSTFHANHLWTSVRNASVTTLYHGGRHHFKHLISKKEISSNF